MDIKKEREAFENHLKKMGKTDNETFSKNEDDSYQMDIIHFGWKIWQAAIARMEVRINTLDEMLLNQGEALAQAKAQADQKVKLLLCDEHLKKCESPTGIFNSQYPDEEPCLICLAKEAKAQAVPEQPKRQGGYYLRDLRSPIGNCMKFWYTNGYGAKLQKFHWFPTLEDVLSHKGGADWFEPWYAPYIDSIAEKTVDFQLADRDQEKAMIEAQEQKG